MKKVISLMLVLTLSILCFNCSNEKIEAKADFSKISESELKQLIQEKEIFLRIIKVDTPGGPTDCRINLLGYFSKIKDLDKEKIRNSFDLFYNIRDHNLNVTSTGILYINAYYYLSSRLKDEPVTLSEIYNYFDILPVVTAISNKLNDTTYKGIIISDSESQKLIDLVKFYKTKRLNDSEYQEVLDSIITDLESISNRNADQIKAFLSM